MPDDTTGPDGIARLTGMEPDYTNEGEEIPIATISFFAASNEMPNLHNPEDKVYAPLLDRFDLKIVTEYIKDKSARQQILHDKISCSDVNHALEPITLDELHRMQQEVAEVEVPEAICDMMDDILCEMRKENLPISDRKFFGFYPIAQALAWLSGKDSVTSDEIRALKLTKQMQRIGLVKKKLTTITLGYTSYPICEIDEQTLTKYAA